MNWHGLLQPALAPEAVLAAVALGLATLDALCWPRRPSRAPAYAAFFGLLTALAAALHGPPSPAGAAHVWLLDDGGTRFADVLVLTAGVLAALLGAARSTASAAGPVLVLAATLGGLVAVGAADLVTLFVGLELASLAAIGRGAIDHRLGLRAALRQSGPAALSAALLAAGAGCLWAAAASPRLADLAAAFAGDGEPLAVVGGALVLAGLAVRAGAVPFHLWLVDATIGGVPAAALVALGTGVAPALIVLARMAGGPLAALPGLALLLTGLGLLSATGGVLLAVPQRRLRRLLGYVVSAHVGFILIAIGVAGPGPAGTAAAGAVHVAVWLQLAALVPAVAGCLAVAGLSGEGPEAAAGLARRQPLQGIVLCLFLTALAGLPPTLAFAGRAALWSALAAGVSPAAGWLAALPALLVLVDAVVLVGLLARFATGVIFGQAQGEAAPAMAALVSVVVLSAAALLGFGLWPVPVAAAAARAAGAG